NQYYCKVVLMDWVVNDRDASLLRMRQEILGRQDLAAAVLIVGMEGVEAEYTLFKGFHPKAKALLVPAPGGAARQLAVRLGVNDQTGLDNVDFASLFHAELAGVAE